MRVRPTGITARAGLRVECLSAPARGSTGSMVAAASTIVLALAAASAADTHVEATEVASMAVAASMAADTGKGFPCMEWATAGCTKLPAAFLRFSQAPGAIVARGAPAAQGAGTRCR